MLKNTLADDGSKLKEELGGYHAEGGAGWMVWVLE